MVCHSSHDRTTPNRKNNKNTNMKQLLSNSGIEPKRFGDFGWAPCPYLPTYWVPEDPVIPIRPFLLDLSLGKSRPMMPETGESIGWSGVPRFRRSGSDPVLGSTIHVVLHKLSSERVLKLGHHFRCSV